MRKVKVFIKKLKLAKAIIFAKESVNVFVSSEDQTKAAITLSLLKNGVKKNSLEDEIVIKRLVDAIYVDLVTDGTNHLHTMSEICETMVIGQSWNMAIAAGITTIWEFKVRIFAARLGISNYLDDKNKKKKMRSLGTNGFETLDKIITLIDEKLKKNLNLRLSQLNEFRGCLVHTNFHQLRAYYNQKAGAYRHELKGNVVQFSLRNADDLKSLSEKEKDSLAEQEDILAWFLEGTNSKMLNLLIDDFEKCIKNLNILIALKGYSVHECSGVFERIVYERKKITSAEEKRFIQRDMFVSGVTNPGTFFHRVYACFKTLS